MEDNSSRRDGKTVALLRVYLFFSTSVASHAWVEACIYRHVLALQTQEPEECETPADAASGPVKAEEGGRVWQMTETSGRKPGEQRFSRLLEHSLVISLLPYTEVCFRCSL